MHKFYFTYGSENHPFLGGWTEIEAPDENTARMIFLAIHPSDDGMHCSSVYTEKEFLDAGFNTKGNFGQFAHEVLTYKRLS